MTQLGATLHQSVMESVAVLAQARGTCVENEGLFENIEKVCEVAISFIQISAQCPWLSPAAYPWLRGVRRFEG